MVRHILMFGVLGVVGCSTFPRDTPPVWQSHSEHYLISGRQGWMPGRQLNFGPYQIDVDKSSDFGVLEKVLFNARHQKVSLTLTDPMGVQATLRYQQKCDGHHGNVTFYESNPFSARMDIQTQHVTFTTPYQVRVDGQQYRLRFGESNWPQIIEVQKNHQPFFELHLGVSDGSWQTQDHLWFVKGQTAAETKIGALLAGYAMVYQADFCDIEQDS